MPSWRTDLPVGLTLGVLLVPQSMAYALLAGVPPVYGLYAALVPLVVYALLASTPYVSVGPTAIASLLTFNGLSGLAEPGSSEFIGLAVLLAGLAGVLQLIFGLLRLGGLVSLLSRPVLSGFVSAAAVLIILSQTQTLLGIDGWDILAVHWPSLLLGLATILALAVGRRLPERIPVMLVWIVVATLLVYSLRMDRAGIAVVGAVPGGLPLPSLPVFSWTTVTALLPTALVIALISFVETLSIGKRLVVGRGRGCDVDPNRELMALGISKLGGSVFQAIPTSASFSRSAVVAEAGGRSVLAHLAGAALVVGVLLLLTPLFYYLPLPALAGIIVFSVAGLIDWREARRLYRLAPRELIVLLVTFTFTLLAGLQWGIAGGVLLSLAFVLLRAARPHVAELGRIPATNAFRNCERFPEVETDPAVLIVRFDAGLYYHNAEYFYDRLTELARRRGDALRTVVLDAHTINAIDSTGLYQLRRFEEFLREQGIQLLFTGMIGPVRDRLYRDGLMDELGAECFYLSINQALATDGRPRDWNHPATQHR